MRVMFESEAGDISGPRYVKHEQLKAADGSVAEAARAFRRGTPYFVTATMTQLILERCYQRGQSHGDPPTPTGFMWFEKKIKQQDGGNLRALAWETWKDGTIAHYWFGWHPRGSARYSEIVHRDEGPDAEIAELESRDLLFTAFGLMAERVSVVSRVHAPTPGRLRRHGRIETEDVRVIQLRAVDHIGGAPTGATHEYSCQWMVRGHPHRYWVGKGEQRHLEIRFVRPYLKGRDGAPFKEPASPIYAVAR